RPETTYSGINVTSFSPTSGSSAGGTSVSIFGINFKPGATVAFGGVPSPAVTWVNCSRINAVAPPGSGAVGLTVTNPDGPFFYTASSFPHPAPAVPSVFVTGITPAEGPAVGGTSITINGSGFPAGGAAAVVFIFATGATAQATSVSVPTSNTITAVTPPGQAGAPTV